MSASSIPVFWKDVRSLLKPLTAFLMLQAVYGTGVLVAARFLDGDWLPFTAVGEVTVLTAIAFSQIFGLVAAGYVFAEEDTAGTHVFLHRLATSRARIITEKLAAGVAVLLLMILIQSSLHVIALPFGGLWGVESPLGILDEAMSWITSPAVVAVTLLVACFGSYAIGVLVSLITRQTLVIVVVSYAIETVIYGFGMMAVDDRLFVTWDVAWMNFAVYAPLLLLPLLIAAPGSRFRIPGAASLLAPGRTPISGLLWKSITENSALQVLSLTFLVASIVTPLEPDATLVSAGALLLLLALGTASYSSVEKQGLDCVLYQHPVPRGQLFLAKTGAAALPVLAVAAGVLLFLEGQRTLWFGATLAESAFAYTCAVLMTLTFESAVIALLAAASVTVTTLLLPLGLLSFFSRVADINFVSGGAEARLRASVPGADPVLIFFGFAVPTTLLAIGCLWAARRMATDPAVLTGSPPFRLKWFASHYAIVVAVAFLVTLVWWRAPLSLMS